MHGKTLTIVTNYNTINLNGKATRPVHGCPTSANGKRARLLIIYSLMIIKFLDNTHFSAFLSFFG